MKKTLLFVAFMVANFCLAQTYMNGGLSTGATSKSGAAAPQDIHGLNCRIIQVILQKLIPVWA
jgi:hypothetical protein